MQPHTAAIITVFLYLLNQADDKLKVVNTTVEYDRQVKKYRIELVSRYNQVMKLRVADFWSCTVEIKYQDHHAYTRHDNESHIREEFDFYPSSVLNGRTENSALYKNFKGDIYNQAKQINFTGEYKGKQTDYTVYIR